MTKSKDIPSSLYENTLFARAPQLNIVHANYVSSSQATLNDLILGYERLRVLTYSSSITLINHVAELVDDLEVIFGREDIIYRIAHYIAYQDKLIRELKHEFSGNDYIRQKIDVGKLRLYVVKGTVSHEKLFLLEGTAGTRVISGSANFSERAFSGNQNESFICFDNDSSAWSDFSEN